MDSGHPRVTAVGNRGLHPRGSRAMADDERLVTRFSGFIVDTMLFVAAIVLLFLLIILGLIIGAGILSGLLYLLGGRP